MSHKHACWLMFDSYYFAKFAKISHKLGIMDIRMHTYLNARTFLFQFFSRALRPFIKYET